MHATSADAPRPRLWVTVTVILLALAFWGVVVAEFLLAAPALLRVAQNEAQGMTWSSRIGGRFALDITTNPVLMAISFVVGASVVGGLTWLIRHRLGKPWLALIWCLLVVLTPLVLAITFWFGTILPLAERMRELNEREDKAAAISHARIACTGSPSISVSGRCCRS